jgi:phosphoribosylformylglycinamidine synthase subunit PurQ / glutaminase
MRVAVVTFPGSNCDRDAQHVLSQVVGVGADLVRHDVGDLAGFDAIVLPGGFSYGDYLRTGAMAAHTPVMGAVRAAAARGVPVLGICNGFQVLLEAGLLPGAMLRNADVAFHCEWVHLRVEGATTPFTAAAHRDRVLRMPIAHGEGNYHAGPELLAELEGEGRVVFRYTDAAGRITDGANPNGSIAGIAGICSERRNIVALMPHPERCSEPELGGTDGLVVFQSLLATAGVA